MKSDEKPIANPLIILREEFDDWAVLFDPDTGCCFGLSPTGVFVWKLLDGEHSVDDLLEDIRTMPTPCPRTRESVSGCLSMRWLRRGSPDSTAQGLAFLEIRL